MDSYQEVPDPVVGGRGPKRRPFNGALSWFAVVLGLLYGFYGLVISGQVWVPRSSIWSDWFKDWPHAVGQGLLGIVFIVASTVALRDRRRAGLSFLVCAPIIAACLAYPEAVFQWTSGPGETHQPELLRALALSFLCLFPLLARRVVMSSKRRGAYLLLVSVSLATLVLCTSRWVAYSLSYLTPWSGLFLVFGAFWLGTYKLGWPPLIAAGPMSVTRRLAMVLSGFMVVAGLTVAAQFVLAARQSSLFGGDCSGRPLFVRPLRPEHAVFTAHLLRVSHDAKVTGR